MAYYLVVAKPKRDRLSVLLRNLQQRAYFTMRPFGRSLTYSLEHARLRDDGFAIWEEDYCSPPLAQERAAALDEFFDDLEVTVVEKGDGLRLRGFHGCSRSSQPGPLPKQRVVAFSPLGRLRTA